MRVLCVDSGRTIAWDCSSRREAEAIVKVVTAFGACCAGDHIVVEPRAARRLLAERACEPVARHEQMVLS